VPAPWRDEQATVSATSRSWSQLLDLVTGSTDAVHATFYALMKPWIDLVGADPFWMRLPGAIAVGLAAAGVVALGTQLDRTRTGVFAATVLVLLPRVFWAGGETRSYALQIAAAVWLTVLLVHAVRRGRWWRWVLFGLATAAANWLFLYLALIGVAHLVTLALVPAWRSRLLPALAAIVAAALASLPIVLLGFAQRSQISWVPVPDLGVVGAVAKSQWFLGSTLFAVVAWVLVIGGIVAIARTRPTRRELLAVLLPWLILPTVVLVVVSVVVSPIYLDRYLGMSAPAIALLAAFAILSLPPIPAHVALLVVLAAAVPVAVEQRTPTTNGDWGQVAALTADAAREGDAVYFSTDPFDDEPRGLVTFYPAAFAGLDDIAFLESAAEAGTLRDRVGPLSAALAVLPAGQTLVTILSDASDAAAADRATLERRGFDETVVGDTGLTTVSRWSSPG
jgi:mannosyltransferase